MESELFFAQFRVFSAPIQAQMPEIARKSGQTGVYFQGQVNRSFL